jgi:hypothetical protein
MGLPRTIRAALALVLLSVFALEGSSPLPLTAGLVKLPSFADAPGGVDSEGGLCALLQEVRRGS